MTRQYPDYKLELVNKESQAKHQGVVQRVLRSPSNVVETSEISSDRIEDCLEGVEEAVKEQVQENGYSGKKSREISKDKERTVHFELDDAKITVEASVFNAKKEGREHNPKALPEHAKSEVRKAGPQGEKVPNSGIEITYSFESDSGEYRELYKDIAGSLIHLKEEFNLSEGTFFGQNPPRYKSVMN